MKLLSFQVRTGYDGLGGRTKFIQPVSFLAPDLDIDIKLVNGGGVVFKGICFYFHLTVSGPKISPI